MSNNYIRPDGRKVDELRNVEVEVGVLNRADGSAKATLGRNMAIASVFGPREMHPKHSSRPDRANVRINYRMATFSVKDYKRSFPSRREKEISKVLSEAFESIVLTKMYPRSVIDVHVQIFTTDGGTRTAAAIAISAALADAGIPMRDLTGGIASGLYEDMVCLDLNGLEDNVGTGDMPLLYSPNIDEISLFQLDGMFTFEQFKQSYNYSLEAIKTIVDKIKEALKSKYVVVRDELALEDEEEEVETEYSSADEEQELAPPVSHTESIEASSPPEPIEKQPMNVTEAVTEEERPAISTSSTTEEVSSMVASSEGDVDSAKSMTDLIADQADKENLDISEVTADADSDETEFDRSGLKPMGGIIQKIASSEEDNLFAEGEEDNNLKDLYKKIKNDDEEDSGDIIRDIEYSDLEEDN